MQAASVRVATRSCTVVCSGGNTEAQRYATKVQFNLYNKIRVFGGDRAEYCYWWWPTILNSPHYILRTYVDVNNVNNNSD